MIRIQLLFVFGACLAWIGAAAGQFSGKEQGYNLGQASLAARNGGTSPALEQRLSMLSTLSPNARDKAYAYFYLGRLRQHKAETAGPKDSIASLIASASSAYQSCVNLGQTGAQSKIADAHFYNALAQILSSGAPAARPSGRFSGRAVLQSPVQNSMQVAVQPSIQRAIAEIGQMDPGADPHVFIDHLMWTADSRYVVNAQFDTAGLKAAALDILRRHLRDRNFPDVELEAISRELMAWCAGKRRR